MEYLSRILGVVAQQDGFRFHPLCGHIRLNHLLFADDLLLFCKGTETSIMWLLRSFSTFSNASGLTLNKAKSEIFFNGMSSSVMDNILQVSGFRKGQLPFKYLGVPISAKKLSKAEGMKLVDRIVARIRGWGSRHLSYAGRLVLVQWVSHVYMKDCEWSSYSPPSDCSWTWKKITHIMKKFKQAYTNNQWLDTSIEYTVKAGYSWLCGSQPKDRLLRMGIIVDGGCEICAVAPEDHKHLFSECRYTRQCLALFQQKINDARINGLVKRPGFVIQKVIDDVLHRFRKSNAAICKPRERAWLQQIS
ncbi:uncharacterized protein LOC141627773 [Silene latifolia]|uniref:uncharacterized protein LOC141627773 n=1 Tax=Silene latifolia TaxID=37657 RepID=UPI003D775A8E